MQVAVEISYYPLTPEYERPIITFIQDLKQTEGLRIATNQLSTHIAGEYDLVMNSLQAAMKRCMADGPKGSFVLKVLNVEIEPGKTIEV
ncbi:MAG: hypothetical protein AAF433_19685 [Bacteroidota bacterium]